MFSRLNILIKDLIKSRHLDCVRTILYTLTPTIKNTGNIFDELIDIHKTCKKCYMVYASLEFKNFEDKLKEKIIKERQDASEILLKIMEK